MSSKSNDQGRAFEYACIMQLENAISKYRKVIVDEVSTVAAYDAWNVQTLSQQKQLIIAADAFIETLFQAEPLILEQDEDDDVLLLSINKDSDAEGGDVRDIVITRNSIKWEIGLSMKHNHFAVKHSRLSPTIDFGNKWYSIPCDEFYWKQVLPIFDSLRDLKIKNVAWHDLTDKEGEVYYPIVNAFIQQIQRSYSLDNTLPTRLLSYLLGIKDFYKVVAIDNERITEFASFNFRGELNHDGKRTHASLFVPLADLPTEIISIRFKPNSSSTAELYMNNGWTLSFRIHNASTIVEPSLKFDIQFLGVPATIMVINCQWR